MDMNKLFNDLKRGEVGNLYIFYGPEDFLIREAVGRIKEMLIPASKEQLNFTVMDGSTAAADSIINTCETLPFMNERRLVIVNNAVFTTSGRKGFSKEDIEKLQSCFESLPGYTCLVITTKTSPDMRTKVMKTAKSVGNVVEFGRLKPHILEKWVAKRFAGSGKKISPAVLKRFIALTGYLDRDSDKTLEGIANEIEKVVEYCEGRDIITKEDIEALAPENLDTNIFKLVDSIGGRDISRAVGLLEDIRRSGEPPVRVLFMVARQFRLLLQASYMKGMGYSGRAVASKLQLPPFVADSLMRQTANFTREDLKKALKECGEVDIRIKSGRIEPWLALELLIASL
ncbi:MAG: DNA polymerase III subunit delta [Clostridia bacterium]|jgi:DNA polymerase-3 subunit delta